MTRFLCIILPPFLAPIAMVATFRVCGFIGEFHLTQIGGGVAATLGFVVGVIFTAGAWVE